MAEVSKPRTPIRLYVGFGGTALVVATFVCAYFFAGDTTPGGWCATFAAGLELSGVLLVASPELRPIVERLGRATASEVRSWPRRLRDVLRRLLHRPREHRITLGGAVETDSALGLEVKRGLLPAPAREAPQDQQVEYLLRVTEQIKRSLGTVENDLRRAIEEVRGEIQRTAIDLTEQTTDAVHQLAQSELRMRLFGVACITAGLMLSYAANIA